MIGDYRHTCQAAGFLAEAEGSRKQAAHLSKVASALLRNLMLKIYVVMCYHSTSRIPDVAKQTEAQRTCQRWRQRR